jgi:hypothetical protein
MARQTLSCWLGARSFGWGALFLMALIAAPEPGRGQLPPGPLTNPPQPGETETIQAGGRDGNYSWYGDLRCQRPNQAIVGVRIRTGSVLDYLQIACAVIECPNGKCGWTSYVSTISAGDPNGGQNEALLSCDADQVLSGYQASVKKIPLGFINMEYVEDISIQCATIAGPPDPQHPGVVPIREPKGWHNANNQLKPGLGASLAKPGVCEQTGASAVSAAVGHWGLGRANVVQALSLFCGGGQSVCPKGTHTYYQPLGPDLYNRQSGRANNAYCPECCKPCATLNGSTNAVTGRTDREVANLPAGRYNCHFYTLSYMNYVTPPNVKGRVPKRYDFEAGLNWELSSTMLSDEDMEKYGWTRTQKDRVDPAALRPGDVVTIVDEASQTPRVHHNLHSAIVIQAGGTVVVRQKPNPVACVTDFTWDEMLAFYRARRVNAWRLGN